MHTSDISSEQKTNKKKRELLSLKDEIWRQGCLIRFAYSHFYIYQVPSQLSDEKRFMFEGESVYYDEKICVSTSQTHIWIYLLENVCT